MKRMTALLMLPLALLALAGCGSTPEAGAKSVVGQWGGVPEQSPELDFAEAGTFTGNDGCNSMNGSWTQEGETVTLGATATTLMACDGVDTWLSLATTAKIDGANLNVFNKDGQQIGVLAGQ